jgi:hypothetical protein
VGHVLFFLFAVLAGLLWTATCTAAAARLRTNRWQPLLAALGAGVPVIVIVPIVAATAWLAFVLRIPSNWFAYAITMLVSLLVGGAWIVRAGLAPGDVTAAPASRWPLVGLAGLCAIATAVTAGTLLILDNAVAAQAPYLRLEAAQLMQSNLPPRVNDDDNAAPLHLQAAAAIAADTGFSAEDSPLFVERQDIMRDEVTDFLARHAATLDLVRRAADRDTCRFTRDWTRPSIDLLLPEILDLRNEGRLVALAARRAAAEGRHADALADIARIQRLGRHAASEPILISYLVGIALERVALIELVELLPRLRAADAPLLDSPAVRDLVTRTLDLLPALHGEEAFGLATFAGFADGRMTSREILDVAPDPTGNALAAISDVGPIFRVFFLPDEVRGYRRLMHAYQLLVARREDTPGQTTKFDEAEALERKLRDEPPGILSRMLFPALSGVFQARGCDEARRRAAAVLVAATKQRLASGVVPTEPAAFTGPPPFVMPADPFAADGGPMRMKQDDSGVVVYSVGPDGEDDGGPADEGDTPAGEDDVGLVMRVLEPAAT